VTDLGIPQGSEAGFPRPVVVVTAQRVLDREPTVVQVVPVTSAVRGYESEVTLEPGVDSGLDHRSVAQCQHVRAIARSRLGDPIGRVDAVELRQVRETLAILLDA